MSVKISDLNTVHHEIIILKCYSRCVLSTKRRSKNANSCFQQSWKTTKLPNSKTATKAVKSGEFKRGSFPLEKEKKKGYYREGTWELGRKTCRNRLPVGKGQALWDRNDSLFWEAGTSWTWSWNYLGNHTKQLCSPHRCPSLLAGERG